MSTQTVTSRISELEDGYSSIKDTVEQLSSTSQVLSQVTSSLAQRTSSADDLVSIPARISTVIKLYQIAASQKTTLPNLLSYIADNISVAPPATAPTPEAPAEGTDTGTAENEPTA